MHVSCTGEGTEVWRLQLSPSSEGRILIDQFGVRQLGAILARATEAPDCRVLVLEAEPGLGCQGMDLGQVVQAPVEETGPAVQSFGDCLAALCACPQVVLAAVDGDVAGGGVGLSAAADLVIATRRSSFALPELTLGLLPAAVLPVLRDRMTRRNIRQLCLFGGVDAERASRLGLVDRVVPEPGDLEPALREAIKAALRVSPAAVARLKELQRELDGLPRAEALRTGARHTVELLASEQTRAPIRAFLEGEPLPWFSRYRPERSGS